MAEKITAKNKDVIQIGLSTHNQDHEINPIAFSTTKISVKTTIGSIPDRFALFSIRISTSKFKFAVPMIPRNPCPVQRFSQEPLSGAAGWMSRGIFILPKKWGYGIEISQATPFLLKIGLAAEIRPFLVLLAVVLHHRFRELHRVRAQQQTKWRTAPWTAVPSGTGKKVTVGRKPGSSK